jgi:F-type H+-transporting ATPase subunit b
MVGQLISFVLFVLFCMKFVWPPLTQVMRERQKALADGLEKASAAEKQLEAANDAAANELEEAKKSNLLNFWLKPARVLIRSLKKLKRRLVKKLNELRWVPRVKLTKRSTERVKN